MSAVSTWLGRVVVASCVVVGLSPALEAWSARAGDDAAPAPAWDSRFGIDYVFPLEPPFDQELWPELYARTGARWVNFARVSWAQIEPSAPVNGEHVYRWERLDRAVRLWQRHSFHIVMSLRLGRGWFAGPIRYRPDLGTLSKLFPLRGSDRLPARDHWEDYRHWIAALVERYDADGYRDAPGLHYPVLHYQVGNEYSNPVFWTGTIEDYGTLLKLTVEAAKKACPKVQIIGQGLRWNDLFHDDPQAEHLDERIEAFLRGLPNRGWRAAWQRARRMNEYTLAMAPLYDIVDAGGNGPYPSMSAGYMRWVQRELAKQGVQRPVWDMEARSEPRLVFNRLVQFHRELTVPGGRNILQAMRRPRAPNHDAAVRWYRAEQARLLAKVFVTRFAAGFEKVFMGMPNDWDRSLARFSVANPYLGLASADGRPWPAFHTLSVLVEHLDGFQVAGPVVTGSGVCLFRFDFGDGRPSIWVAWLREETPRGMDAPLPSLPVTLPPITGRVRVVTIPTEGANPSEAVLGSQASPLRLLLTPTPVLIIPLTQ